MFIAAVRAGVFAFSVVLSAPTLSADPPIASESEILPDCDDGALAICLSNASEAFNECEADCSIQFPNGGADYFQCRDDCRAQDEQDRRDCYEAYCPERRPQ